MKLVLLSGGFGKRLWPLSNDTRSKQFLRVLRSDTGELESMVERVWRQFGAVGLAESAYIATGKAQVDMLQNQLGAEAQLIIEPERRDTFPAIALAASYLFSVAKVEPSEVVAILPVDPFVEDRFFLRVKALEDALQHSEADLALIGVVPTFPSMKYGYIVPERRGLEVELLKVGHFQEKPDEEAAKVLITEGAFWNCGIFSFRLKFMLDHIKRLGLPLDYRALQRDYAKLPKISFDYQVVEKTENIIVLPYQGEWKDLGTWNTLTEEMSGNLVGKGLISQDSENSHLINELDIPVALLGLPNVIVAASPDGILVSEKSASPRVKEMAEKLNHRPMFEERRWGWYKVLDHIQTASGEEVLIKRIGILPGKNLSYQLHALRTEVWTIIQGEGEFAINDVIYPVKAGEVLQIPVGSKHAIRALTHLEFIEVQSGTDLVEEDIIRLCMSWEEIEEACIRARHERVALG